MYYFLVNPSSGSGQGQKDWEIIESMLDAAGADYRVYFTTKVKTARDLAEEITSENRNEKCVLVALGGDGSINEAVNGIVDFEKVTFVHIPSGSGNDFERSLKDKRSLEERVFALLHPRKIEKIDLGEIMWRDADGEQHIRRFAVSTGIGFDAAVCKETSGGKWKEFLNKLKLGQLIYVCVALKNLLFMDKVDMELSIEDKKIRKQYHKTFFIATHNCAYEGGGFKFCPKAKVTDGKLWLCAVAGVPMPLVAFALPSAYFGKHTLFPGIQVMDGKQIRIRAEKPMTVHTDGEVVCETDEVYIRVLPGVMSMIHG